MIKAPLSVYIIWHPKFVEGKEYLRDIYSEISRSYLEPTLVSCGIPTYFAEGDSEYEHQINIDFETAERIAVFIFIDTKMLLDDGGTWHKYIGDLTTQCKRNDLFRIYPIAMNKSALKIQVNGFSDINFIRLFEKEESIKKESLLFSIKHDLCRLMFKIESVNEASKETKQPVKLFLSHAKADGKDITKCVRDYINADTGIEDFFDAVDIAQGKEFLKEIEENISTSSMLVAFRTDAYSKSEWCKKEVMIAKEKRIPVLVVDCLKKGESRAFPYLGNTKTIRYSQSDEVFCIQMLSLAMSEILSKLFQSEITKQMVDIYKIPIKNKNVFDYPPELFSLNSWIDASDKNIIYPEPPLGCYELEMLSKYWPGFNMITPTSIPSMKYKLKLEGINVGISVSEPGGQNQEGIGTGHCMAISLELARYLLANGADLCYGGDINYAINRNFTKSLVGLVEMYDKEHSDETKRITNYVANYLSQSITDEMRTDLYGTVNFKIMKEINLFDNLEIEQEIKQKVLKTVDLTSMRNCMNECIDVRVVLGGKMHGFTGMYPGILEEVIMAVEKSKPVYLIGGYGGITSEIVKCISGIKAKLISNERLTLDENENNFVQYYNSLSSLNLEKIDYNFISDMLAKKGINGLNNGLSDDENKILFKSKNIYEIISIILKGLYNIFGK